MNVYSLFADGDNYQSLELVNEETDWEIIYKFNGNPLAAEWRPLRVKIMDDEDTGDSLPPSDSPSLFTGAPVLSRRAAGILQPILEGKGELLPLEFDSHEYFVFNITSLVDALDEGASEIVRFPDGKKIMDIKRFVFIPSQLEGVDVFKLPQRPLGGVFVTDRFVQTVRQAGLVGFEFEWLWASEQRSESTLSYSQKLQ